MSIETINGCSAIRLNECIDLVAAEAIYHKACYSRFNKVKKLPSTIPLSCSRPVSKTLSEVFYELCEWLDTQTKLYSLPELHEKMVELSRNGETYTVKTKLKEHHNDCIKPNIVCFSDTNNYIINSKWYGERQ